MGIRFTYSESLFNHFHRGSLKKDGYSKTIDESVYEIEFVQRQRY
jgi:hypothetical protein